MGSSLSKLAWRVFIYSSRAGGAYQRRAVSSSLTVTSKP
jgi:hypothetical protein